MFMFLENNLWNNLDNMDSNAIVLNSFISFLDLPDFGFIITWVV